MAAVPLLKPREVVKAFERLGKDDGKPSSFAGIRTDIEWFF
jgi:hypothetical protein